MRLRLLSIFLFLSFYCAAQQEVFQGIVVDSATFSPLPYVSIRVQGTLRGTSSDGQGNFSIKAERKDSLTFSLVGYSPVTIALWDWEPGVVRMSEQSILLKSVTIQERRVDPYANMFDEENARIAARRIPFYFSRVKKEKRRLVWLREDNVRAKTYVSVVITNPDTKDNLMTKYGLTEEEYYKILGDFNQKHYTMMYYLTAGELLSLLNNFYEAAARNGEFK